MPSGGHNRKPTLAVVREGNPGKRPVRDSIVLPPSALREPDWSDFLPEIEAGVARGLWKKLAPTLAQSAGLVGEQQEALVDYCVTWARIMENEKALTDEGVVIPGAMGGVVRNPRTMVLNSLRQHWRSLIGELGLSPRAAAGVIRPDADNGDEDPFD
jgi:P27 family predicted phage terminase small subunit